MLIYRAQTLKQDRLSGVNAPGLTGGLEASALYLQLRGDAQLGPELSVGESCGLQLRLQMLHLLLEPPGLHTNIVSLHSQS